MQGLRADAGGEEVLETTLTAAETGHLGPHSGVSRQWHRQESESVERAVSTGRGKTAKLAAHLPVRVIQHPHVDQSQRPLQALGNLPICQTGLAGPGGMIVHQDHGGRVQLQASPLN